MVYHLIGISLIAIFLSEVDCLIQPTLDLKLPLHVDFDTYNFIANNDGNKLSHGYVEGSFNSTVKF